MKNFNSFVRNLPLKLYSIPNIAINGNKINEINRMVLYFYFALPIVSILSFKYLNLGGANFVGLFVLSAASLNLLYLLVNQKIKIQPYYKYLILLIIYFALVDFSTGKIAEVGIIRYIYANTTLKALALFFIIEMSSFESKFIRKIHKLLIVIVLFSLFATLIQVVIDENFLINPIREETISTYGGTFRSITSIYTWMSPNSIGFTFVPIIAILISYSFVQNRRSIYAAIIGGIVTIISAGRYIMINYLFALIPYFRQKNSKIKNIFMVVFTILFILLILANYIFPSLGFGFDLFYKQRILSTSVLSRIKGVEVFNELYWKNPVLGTWIHSYSDEKAQNLLAGESSQIHVGFLDFLYTYGIVGGILLFGFLFNFWKRFYRIARLTKFDGSLICLVIFIFSNFTLVYLNFFEMALPLGLLFAKYFEQRIWKIKMIKSGNNFKENLPHKRSMSIV